jgi:HSP20 family protein
MSIATRSMAQELETLRERFDRFARDFPRFGEVPEASGISLDIQETDDAVIVKASVPGIKAEDLTVDVRNDLLTVRGETREERDETEGTWHRKERRVGRFYRAVTLPATVTEVNAEARLADGVLEIRLPKAEHTEEHRIPVQPG